MWSLVVWLRGRRTAGNGAGKRVKGRKIHGLDDSEGLPMNFS
jgi:hypothetical protein